MSASNASVALPLKGRISARIAANPNHEARRGATGNSAVAGALAASGVVVSLAPAESIWVLTANQRTFSRIFTAMIAVVAAQRVASKAVPTIAVGRVEPAATRIAIAVVGINWTEAVFMARNVHIAFVARPGWVLSASKSRSGRRPGGV